MKNIAVLTVALATLAGCGPSREQVDAMAFTAAQTATPLDLFVKSCLDTLPDFAGFEAEVSERNMTLEDNSGGTRAYETPDDKKLVATLSKEAGRTACGVGFLGSTENAVLGAQFLEEATKRTGGEPRKKYPSSYFAYAYHLKNGSVMTHDTRSLRGHTRHIFLISPPVPASEVDEYIYN